MYKSGHTGLSLLLYSPILYLLIIFDELLLAMLGFIIVFMYSSVPDLDFKVPKVKHRGYSHSLVGALVIAIPLPIITFVSYTYIQSILANSDVTLQYSPLFMAVLSFIFGYFAVLTHYAGDIVTPSGIPIFAPVDKTNHSLNLFYAKSKIANGFFLFAGMFSIVLVIFSQVYPIFDSIL